MDCQNSLKDALTDFLEKHPAIEGQKSLAVAVSGGPDSMALAHLLCGFVGRENKTLHILTIDHGLRAEAKEEAKKVADWAAQQDNKNINHAVLQWEGKKPETGIMEAARAARYELIDTYCKNHKIEAVFVAHHQDDQAETFLIRLAKGSGLDGLAGMNELQSYSNNLKIARPFLNISKQDLISYCEENSINFINDPSNENKEYLRPRLRKSMVILEEEGLSPKRLSSLSSRLRRARQALEVISEESYQKCLKEKSEKHIVLNFDEIQTHPEEIIFRIIRKAVEDMRQNNGYGVRMERLESLVTSLTDNPAIFKSRTLGGLIFALKDKNRSLYIKKE